MKTITLRFFSHVGPRHGAQDQAYQTNADTARQLLHEIQTAGTLPLTTHISKAILNDEFVEWDAPIRDGDRVTFLPPFSGG